MHLLGIQFVDEVLTLNPPLHCITSTDFLRKRSDPAVLLSQELGRRGVYLGKHKVQSESGQDWTQCLPAGDERVYTRARGS